jgi:tetratricopeptide (TPR) repeat protein
VKTTAKILLAVLAPAATAQERVVPPFKYEFEFKQEGCASNLKPEALELQRRGSDLFWVRGRTLEAVALLEKAVGLEPRLIGAYVNLGTFYALAQNSPGKSVTLLQGAVRHCPQTAALQFSLAEAYAAANQHQEAIKSYHKARELGLELAPSFFYNLGNSHVRLKEWDRAIENYREALSRDPKHLNARRNLAITYYQKGDRKSAIECAQELEKLDPNGKHGAWAREALVQIKDD